MANPSRQTIRAAQYLQKHHKEDSAVFYATENGESAVVIVNDPNLLEVIMVLMNYTDAKNETGPSEDGPVVVMPLREIEA
jgi:hypothetical protein